MIALYYITHVLIHVSNKHCKFTLILNLFQFSYNSVPSVLNITIFSSVFCLTINIDNVDRNTELAVSSNDILIIIWTILNFKCIIRVLLAYRCSYPTTIYMLSVSVISNISFYV